MKIAIEGMDGVGKTTISRKISEEFGMVYIEKPLTNLFDTKVSDGKETLDAVSRSIYNFDDEIIKAWFFGLGNIYSIIKNYDNDIVIDRHFASNYFWNGSDRSDCIFETMINLIGVPDITIVLTASIESRLNRLYLRNPNDYDLTDPEKMVKGDDKMIMFLEKFNIPYISVDTNNKSIEEVYGEVKNIILSLNNVKKRSLKKC